jgi:uncharacterized protein YukE
MSECVPLTGDSAGMRALASALRQTASSVSACDSAASPKVACLTFTGPAATRLQSALGDWHSDLSSAANLLNDAADLLVRAASDLDEERARLARLEHE